MNEMWSKLVQSGVDMVITDHDHSYQRWTSLDAYFKLNPKGAEYRYYNIAGQLLDQGVVPCSGTTDTAAPYTPAGLAATTSSSGHVALSWNGSWDETGAAAPAAGPPPTDTPVPTATETAVPASAPAVAPAADADEQRNGTGSFNPAEQPAGPPTDLPYRGSNPLFLPFVTNG